MQLKGTIKVIHPQRNPSETFAVREFILDTSSELNGRFITEYVGCQMTQKNCQLLDNYKAGDEVVVDGALGSSNIVKNKQGLDSCINNFTVFRIKLQNPEAHGAPKAQENAPW